MLDYENIHFQVTDVQICSNCLEQLDVEVVL